MTDPAPWFYIPQFGWFWSWVAWVWMATMIVGLVLVFVAIGQWEAQRQAGRRQTDGTMATAFVLIGWPLIPPLLAMWAVVAGIKWVFVRHYQRKQEAEP